jgi:hypothetical protein
MIDITGLMNKSKKCRYPRGKKCRYAPPYISKFFV